MIFGIVLLMCIPCRAEPNDRAEIVTQLLFGETYQVIEKQEKWYLVENTADGYRGWICAKQHAELVESEFNQITASHSPININEGCSVELEIGKVRLGLGAKLPNYSSGSIRLNGKEYLVNDASFTVEGLNIQHVAKMFLNTPYLWGGRSSAGIDCSGFTQLCYSIMGCQLPRDAWQQAEFGNEIAFDNLMVGDLVFFDNDQGKITHVGLMLENFKIIHASGRVRIDRLRRDGIYNLENNSKTHNLKVTKRIER